ncbi:MAG: hypothetical protein V1747_02200 [Candidatus Omnitrophota bacterium]
MKKLVDCLWFKLICLVLINSFLMLDIAWAGGTELNLQKNSDTLAAPVQITQQMFNAGFSRLYEMNTSKAAVQKTANQKIPKTQRNSKMKFNKIADQLANTILVGVKKTTSSKYFWAILVGGSVFVNGGMVIVNLSIITAIIAITAAFSILFTAKVPSPLRRAVVFLTAVVIISGFTGCAFNKIENIGKATIDYQGIDSDAEAFLKTSKEMKSFKQLAAILENENEPEENRVQAALKLSKLRHKNVESTLIKQLNAFKIVNITGKSGLEFGYIHPIKIDRLPANKLRAAVAWALGELRSEKAVEELIFASTKKDNYNDYPLLNNYISAHWPKYTDLIDSSANVQINCILALGKIGNKKAEEHLKTRMLNNGNWQVDYAVLSVLAGLGDEKAKFYEAIFRNDVSFGVSVNSIAKQIIREYQEKGLEKQIREYLIEVFVSGYKWRWYDLDSNRRNQMTAAVLLKFLGGEEVDRIFAKVSKETENVNLEYDVRVFYEQLLAENHNYFIASLDVRQRIKNLSIEERVMLLTRIENLIELDEEETSIIKSFFFRENEMKFSLRDRLKREIPMLKNGILKEIAAVKGIEEILGGILDTRGKSSFNWELIEKFKEYGSNDSKKADPKAVEKASKKGKGLHKNSTLKSLFIPALLAPALIALSSKFSWAGDGILPMTALSTDAWYLGVPFIVIAVTLIHRRITRNRRLLSKRNRIVERLKTLENEEPERKVYSTVPDGAYVSGETIYGPNGWGEYDANLGPAWRYVGRPQEAIDKDLKREKAELAKVEKRLKKIIAKDEKKEEEHKNPVKPIDKVEEEKPMSSTKPVYQPQTETLISVKSLLNAQSSTFNELNADVLLLCGNDDIGTFKETLRLYKAGKIKKILLTGGYGRLTLPLLKSAQKMGFNIRINKDIVINSTDDLTMLQLAGMENPVDLDVLDAQPDRSEYKKVIPLSESEIIYQIMNALAKMLDIDIAPDDLYLETTSTNTPENFKLAMPYLEQIKKDLGKDEIKVAYMQVPYQQFRTKATFNRFKDEWKDMGVTGISYTTDWDTSKLSQEQIIEMAALESGRLIIYSAKGDLVPLYGDQQGLDAVPDEYWKQLTHAVFNLNPDAKEKLKQSLFNLSLGVKIDGERVFQTEKGLRDYLDAKGVVANVWLDSFINFIYTQSPKQVIVDQSLTFGMIKPADLNLNSGLALVGQAI